MRIVPVIHVHLDSESLHYRAYDDLLGTETVLDCLLNRIPVQDNCEPAWVTCSTATDFQRLAAITERRDVTLYRQKLAGEVTGLAEVALQSGATTLILIPFGFLFAPAGLVESMLARHIESGNNVTVDESLPAGVAPVILDVELLRQMNALCAAGLSQEATRAIRRIRELAKAETTNLPFVLKLEDHQSVPPALAHLLPRSLAIRWKEDVRTANYALRSLGSGEEDTSVGRLQAWKLARTALLEQGRVELEQAAGISGRTGRVRSGKIRVLFASNPSAFSGAEQSLCQLVRHLDPTRFEKFALLAASGLYADTLKEAGAKVEVRDGGYAAPQIDNFLFALGFLKRLQPDLIHLNGQDSLPLLGAAKSLGIPVVLHIRNNYDDPAFEDSMRAADAMIAISDFTRRFVSQYQVDTAKISVVHNEVDVNWFHPAFMAREEARSALGIDADALVISLIARFTPYKRHLLLLQAVARIAERIPQLQLMLTGELYLVGKNSTYAETVKREAESLGIADRVKWLGFRSDIRTVHSAADVLVLCSDREPLGRCVVEAQAMGVPVVVNNTGGTAEVVRDGETGVVVPGEDVEALAEALERVLCDSALRERMGAAARLHAEQNLSATAAARRVEQVYERVLKARSVTEPGYAAGKARTELVEATFA